MAAVAAGQQVNAVHLYDCHAHLADDRIYPHAEEELGHFRTDGGVAVVVAAARRCEWERVLALSSFAEVRVALGIHPFFVDEWTSDQVGADLDTHLTTSPKVVAVGEIGLDFQSGRENAGRQIEVFAAQLTVACERGLPVVLHNRKSWHEFFGVVDSLGRDIRGVCHNFTGSPELAREILERGLYVSFAGALTYPNAHRAHASARYVPADRILVETDAPDLAPWPRHQAASTPADVRVVLQRLAELRGQAVQLLAQQVGDSFEQLFSGPSQHVGA